MNKKEILKALSSIECDIFYALDEGNTCGLNREDLKAFHDRLEELIETWHDMTGETL